VGVGTGVAEGGGGSVAGGSGVDGSGVGVRVGVGWPALPMPGRYSVYGVGAEDAALLVGVAVRVGGAVGAGAERDVQLTSRAARNSSVIGLL